MLISKLPMLFLINKKKIGSKKKKKIIFLFNPNLQVSLISCHFRPTAMQKYILIVDDTWCNSSPRASLGQRFSVLITIAGALLSNLKLNLELKIFLIGKSVILSVIPHQAFMT